MQSQAHFKLIKYLLRETLFITITVRWKQINIKNIIWPWCINLGTIIVLLLQFCCNCNIAFATVLLSQFFDCLSCFRSWIGKVRERKGDSEICKISEMCYRLTHFRPMSSLYKPWNHQKIVNGLILQLQVFFTTRRLFFWEY